jgi:hypothetical protein
MKARHRLAVVIALAVAPVTPSAAQVLQPSAMEEAIALGTGKSQGKHKPEPYQLRWMDRSPGVLLTSFIRVAMAARMATESYKKVAITDIPSDTNTD